LRRRYRSLAVGVCAAFALDLAWPVLLLLGVESVRIDPGNTAFTNLAFDSYPWTHSLAMVVVWSLLAIVIGRLALRSWRAGGVAVRREQWEEILGNTSMLLFGDARSSSNGFYEHLGAERLLSAEGEFHGGYGWQELAGLVER
jgi:hypothetical protein